MNFLSNLLSILNRSLKANKVTCIVPINKFCYNVLVKLREKGFIYGFSFQARTKRTYYLDIVSETKKKKSKYYFRYPYVMIYLNTYSSWYKDVHLKAYPLSARHFRSVSWQSIYTGSSYIQNRHGRDKNLLLTTTKGLKWEYETINDHIGGKLVLSVKNRLKGYA